MKKKVKVVQHEMSVPASYKNGRRARKRTRVCSKVSVRPEREREKGRGAYRRGVRDF